MMKRATWFVGGVAAGAAGTSYAKRKLTRTVKRTAATLAPSNVARATVQRARRQGRNVVEAVREGRTAMKDREHELTARRDGRVESLDERLQPGDRLLLDGRPVDSAQVILLRQPEPTESAAGNRHRRTRRASSRVR